MKKNLLLVFLFVFLSSCKSQLGTAIGGAIKNIVSGDAFISSSGDEAYQKLKEEYQNKEGASLLDPTCNPLTSVAAILNPETQEISAIKDKLCSCEAWGTCDAKSCGCEVLCPKDFGIFKKVEAGNFDSIDNTLSFTNYRNKFKDTFFYQGYCWGISLITQRFNRLATFSPNLPKKFLGIQQETNRLNEYKDIISRINNNEPVTIPGFVSLYDFSHDPEVKNLLEDSSKDEWSKNAMTTQGLGMISSAATPPKQEIEAMFDDIEFRLKNNMSPAIGYNLKEKKTDAHVLLVSGFGVTPGTNERFLCLRDNNHEAFESMGCNIKMILNHDGTLIREMSRPSEKEKIGKVALAHTENSNTVEQINNLHTKCSNEKDCAKN